jgi:hypothetical protein
VTMDGSEGLLAFAAAWRSSHQFPVILMLSSLDGSCASALLLRLYLAGLLITLGTKKEFSAMLGPPHQKKSESCSRQTLKYLSSSFRLR